MEGDSVKGWYLPSFLWSVSYFSDAKFFRIGFIDYVEQESAQKAIEMFRNADLEGRRLTVQYAKARAGSPKINAQRTMGAPSKALFIGNMSFDMSDRELNNLFSKVRNVVDVRVAIDRRTGQPRGFAHADFVDVESATKAMEQLRNKEVSGRILRIDYSRPSSMRRGRIDDGEQQ
jgi:nucleolin